MEKKNLLHTEQVSVKNRTYYLDLQETEKGNNYLVINQTKSDEEGVTERVKMILFEEDLWRFSQALIKTLFYFKKENTRVVNGAYIAKVRETYPNAFQRWTKEDEELLKDLYQQGHKVEELMVHFKRNEQGIRTRLQRLGLITDAEAAAA